MLRDGIGAEAEFGEGGFSRADRGYPLFDVRAEFLHCRVSAVERVELRHGSGLCEMCAINNDRCCNESRFHV